MTKKNMNNKYMPAKLSSGRRKKILNFLKLSKAPTKSTWGKIFNKKDDWWFHQHQKLTTVELQNRERKKKEKAKAKRNKYQTNISFNVIVKRTDKNGVETNETVRVKVRKTLTYKQTQSISDSYFEAMGEFETNNMYAVIGHHPSPSNDGFVKLKHQPKNKIMKTKMKQVTCERETLRRFKGGMDISDIDKCKSECVIDYLVHIYNNPNKPNHRIQKLTRENIINLLADHYTDIKTITTNQGKTISPFDIKKGITAEQVLLINQKYIRRNVIGVNFDNSVFVKHQEKNLNMKVEKDIVFMIADNHFFPIEDKCIRKKLQGQVQMVNNMNVEEKKDKKEEEKADQVTTTVGEEIQRGTIINPTIDELLNVTDKNVYFTDSEDLTPILIEIMSREHTILDEDLYCDSKGLKKIIWNMKNVYIYANKHYEDSVYNCQQLDYKFENQNLTMIVNKYFDDNYKFQKSCFNDEVDKIFRSDHTKTVAFRDTFDSVCAVSYTHLTLPTIYSV